MHRGGPAIGLLGLGGALISFALPILGVPRAAAWLVFGVGCVLVICGGLWWYQGHLDTPRRETESSIGRAIAEYEAAKAAGSEVRHQALISQLKKPDVEQPSPFARVTEIVSAGLDPIRAAPGVEPSGKAHLLVAARLLRTELLDIRHKVEMLGKNQILSDGFAFPGSEWTEHRKLIAEYPDLYSRLERAYTEAHRVNEIWRWRRTQSTSRLIGVNQTDGIEAVDGAAADAVSALDALIEADQ